MSLKITRKQKQKNMNQTPRVVLGVTAPPEACTDKKCPFHGEILVKRELYPGKVIKRDSNRSATIEWNRTYYVPKYERYELRRSRMRVHNPACLNAQIGQEVLVAKTRPLSKTKHHVIIQLQKKAAPLPVQEKAPGATSQNPQRKKKGETA